MSTHPIPCQHLTLNTTAEAFVSRDDKQRVIGYQISIKAKCAQCGKPFHFPPELPENTNPKMPATQASVSRRCDMLIVPIIPGAFSPPDLN